MSAETARRALEQLAAAADELRAACDDIAWWDDASRAPCYLNADLVARFVDRDAPPLLAAYERGDTDAGMRLQRATTNILRTVEAHRADVGLATPT